MAEQVSLLHEGNHGLERRSAGAGRKRKADETATPAESVKASDEDDEIDELTPAAPKDRASTTGGRIPEDTKPGMEGLERFLRIYAKEPSFSTKGLLLQRS